MKIAKTTILLLPLLLLFSSACSDTNKDEKKIKAPSMKCGAGKCGANMFDGNIALAKKRKNILAQMRSDDPRKLCVMQARNTKALYNCVRSPQNGKLTLKCGTAKEQKKMPKMRCGAGKCGSM